MQSKRMRYVLGTAVVSAFSLLGVARSQCATWDPKFTYPNGVDGTVGAVEVFDDGSGPALYVGGWFARLHGLDANNIARWDGTNWSALGAGVDGAVGDLEVYDDGTGPALYAIGTFSHAGGVPASRIARWDGSSWSALGSGLSGGSDSVYSPVTLAAFTDPGGSALYAGGEFMAAGGVPAIHIARWNGTTWSDVGGAAGSGVTGVYQLAVVDVGSGPQLYAGGQFTSVGGVPAMDIARWDGSTWSPLGSGANGTVTSIAEYDDGSGPALYAGGYFADAGGVILSRIAKWDGAAWSALGAGLTDIGPYGPYVKAMSVFDDGTGRALYVGGVFDMAGDTPAAGIARWNGSSWSAVGSGVDPVQTYPPPIDCMVVFDPGGGPRLFAGGSLWRAGGIVSRGLMSTDGSSWSSLGSRPGHGMSGQVLSFEIFDDGSGPALFAGGEFTYAGDVRAERIAKWNGTQWFPLGSGVTSSGPISVDAMTRFDDGEGADLYVGGRFSSAGGVVARNIARWDGSSWSGVGGESHTLNHYYALESYDSGSGEILYVGGQFTELGSVITPNVGAWTGTSFQSVGDGVDGNVRALAVYDDGAGAKLIVAGNYVHAGALPVNRIAAWDGATWSPLGSGMNEAITCLAVFDDGDGPALFAGGNFTSAGGVSAAGVARWDGASWAPLGGGVGGLVWSLAVFDDENGPVLYAAGDFTAAGGFPASNIARWDGTSWSTPGDGTDGPVRALAVYDDTPIGRPDLYLGGGFGHAGADDAVFIAEWRGCADSPGTPFCFGDESGEPCPCGNSGGLGRGCAHSSADSALLTASGAAANDSVTLRVAGEKPTALTIFLQARAVIAPRNFGDGIRCIGDGLKRLYVKTAAGGIALAPTAGDLSIRERSETLGDRILPGTYRGYMTYYRDPSPTFCPSPTGSTFNSSNATRILW